MSFLSALKGDVKKVFGWIGSPKGQAIVAVAEGAVEDAFPAATSAIGLLNSWGTEIFKVQSMAEAATATGSNLQKAAAVLNTITPQVLGFASTNGLPTPTSAAINKINDNLVEVLNLLTGVASAPATPPAPPAV
jgi:hypothetical protein